MPCRDQNPVAKHKGAELPTFPPQIHATQRQVNSMLQPMVDDDGQSIRTQRTKMLPFRKPLDNVCFPFRLDHFNPFAFHTLKSPPHEKAQQLKTVWAFPPKHIMMHENHSSRKATSLRRANKSWKLAIGWL